MLFMSKMTSSGNTEKFGRFSGQQDRRGPACRQAGLQTGKAYFKSGG